MIKVLIIEDEIPARKKLKRFLVMLAVPVEVVAEIATVEEGIAFLKQGQVDVILSDIELLDGNAFEIYKEVQVNCPIIFTTAYDQFWMNAFESNGIEYLLKPFSFERFQKAWNKFLLLQKTNEKDLVFRLHKLLENTARQKAFKKRFTINTGKGMYFLETDRIAFFAAEEGVIFAFDVLGKRHPLTECTLKEIEPQLPANDFFRINRGELVSKKSIEKVERYSKNALAVKVQGYTKHLLTSQGNTASFREWVEK